MLDTLRSYAYTRVFPLLKKKGSIKTDFSAKRRIAPIAMICDEMTWQNFRRECPVVLLTPGNWKEVFEKYNPAMLFCEAAWSGEWRGQIYKDNRVKYENRHALLRIMGHCKNNGIPTVFWNKEDPAYYRHPTYDFTDTALKFDYILTTAAECVPKYEQEGHKNVHLWTFGFADAIFYPPDDGAAREKLAVFAGSWYPDQPKRCRDTTDVFDFILERGIPLVIYDRNSSKKNRSRRFPEKYREYVRDAVAYEALGDIYRSAEYAVNINTAKDSESMFARRVCEAMACGCVVISNESRGMREQFGGRVWFVTDSFDCSSADEIRRENIREVFAKHANSKRITRLLEIAG